MKKLFHATRTFVSILCFVGVTTFSASAQTQDPLGPPIGIDTALLRVTADEGSSTTTGGTPAEENKDLKICFDYYTFQSVQVSVGADRAAYAPGNTVVFSGELTNENAHPIVDGNVFVRVSMANPDYKKEGNNIVDEFIAKESVVLAGKEKTPVSFSWTVPSMIKNGTYRADFFFSVGKKFNLGGLPFTNEVIVGTTRFDVKGGSSGSVTLDRSGTKVNGASYAHIGEWPRVEDAAPVVIEQPLVNTTGKSRAVTVRYDVYFWDSLNESDRIATKMEQLVLPAGATRTLSYEIPSVDDSVYYVRMAAESEGVRSIVNVRIVSDNSHPRLNYPAITKFPIKKGDAFMLFSCFHNASSGGVAENNTVTVSLYDGSDLIGSVDYTGDIAPDMAAIAKDVTAQKNYDDVRLVARITDANGKIMDQYEVAYECKDFGTCMNEKKYGLAGRDLISPKSIGIGIVAILFVIGVALIVMHRRGVISSK